MKFLKENWKMLAIATTIVILFPIIILTPSKYGTIPYDTGIAIVSYGGSILGGFLTLYGVWWTILEQKRDLKEQQKKLDEQRREDLAIQYKPIFLLTFTNSLISNIPSKNSAVIFYLELKNIGRGESVNLLTEHPQFFNNFAIMISYDKNKTIVQNDSTNLMISIAKCGKKISDTQCELLPINPDDHIHFKFSIIFNDAFFNQYTYTYDIDCEYKATIPITDVKSINNLNKTSTFVETNNSSKITQIPPKWIAKISSPEIKYKKK